MLISFMFTKFQAYWRKRKESGDDGQNQKKKIFEGSFSDPRSKNKKKVCSDRNYIFIL